MVDNFIFKDIPDMGEFLSLPAIFFHYFICLFVIHSLQMKTRSIHPETPTLFYYH